MLDCNYRGVKLGFCWADSRSVNCKRVVSDRGLNCAVCKAPLHKTLSWWYYGTSDCPKEITEWNKQISIFFEERRKNLLKVTLAPQKKDFFDYFSSFILFFLLCLIVVSSALWINGSN